VILDILPPLAVALDGDAAIFPTTMAIDFFPEVYRCVAHHWCAALCWRCTRNGWRGARPLRRWLALSLMVRRVDGSNNELVDVVAHCSVTEEDCWAAGMPLATRHRCPLLPVKEWSYQWCVEADSPVRLLWHLRGHPPVVIVLL
jgi:hypothetical protein